MGASREAGNLHCYRGGYSLKAQEFACRFYKLLGLGGGGGQVGGWGPGRCHEHPLIPNPHL